MPQLAATQYSGFQRSTPLTHRYSADGVNSQVGDIFLKYMEYFKQYTPYAEHYPQAQQTLVRLRRKKGGFSKLLQVRERVLVWERVSCACARAYVRACVYGCTCA